MFNRIIVAVGDRDRVEGLCAMTAQLAGQGGAEVLLVHVAECSACCGAQDHPALHVHERDLVDQLVAELAGSGVRSRGEQRVTFGGRVAEHLLDAAAEFRADLLIVHGARPGRLWDRSQKRVIRRLVDGADCPVLVLPRTHPGGGERRPWRWLLRSRSG